MSVDELIVALTEAKGPSRKLDAELGLLIGYEKVQPKATNDNKIGRVMWRVPKLDKLGKLPWFTYSIDKARDFVNSLLPDHSGGISWGENGDYSAKVNEDPAQKGATIPLAFLISGLTAYKARTGDTQQR